LGALLPGGSSTGLRADESALLEPISQTRSITGNAYAEDAFGDGVNDSDSDSALDLGPYTGAAAADATVDGAIGSGGGQQTSTILGHGIVAEGSMFSNAETWEFGASADASAVNRMQVSFQVTTETDYLLQGQLGAFDQAIAELSLRDGTQAIFETIIFGPATMLPIDESGTLSPGEYSLEIRLEGNVFGSDFYPDYSSGEFEVSFLLGTAGPGGEVPDGDVRLSWSPSCRTADTDYGVYEGELGNPGGLAPVACSTAGGTTWDLSPGFDGTFFLVVPTDGVSEGSYGDDGTGAERMPSPLACGAQLLAAPVCP
jgi:hypothetical protein